MKPAIAASILFSLFLMHAVAAQPCLTGADVDCNNEVNITELLDYIDSWYGCSECVPDLFDAIQAYYQIPFCGDHSCDGGIGEDCSTCSPDCGICHPPGEAYYVSPDGSGDGSGSDPGNAMSLSGAQSFANGNTGTELTFLLLDGQYPDFIDSPDRTYERTEWVNWIAVNPKQAAFRRIIMGNGSSHDAYARFYDIKVDADQSIGQNVPMVLVNRANYVEFHGNEWFGHERYDGIAPTIRGDGFVLNASEIHYSTSYGPSPEDPGYKSRGINIESGSDFLVKDCDIHDMSSTAIDPFYGTSGIIDGCHIHDQEPLWPGFDGTALGKHGSGIGVNGDNLVIRNNVIQSCGNSGGAIFFYTRPHHNITIENNLLYDSKGFGTQSTSSWGRNGRFNNNIVVTNWRDDPPSTSPLRYEMGINFAFTDYRDDFEFYNNMVIGYMQTDGTDISGESDNNIVYSFKPTSGWAGDPLWVNTGLGTDSVILNSQVPGFGWMWKDTLEGGGWDPEDDLFVSPVFDVWQDNNYLSWSGLTGDFDIKGGSPAISFADGLAGQGGHAPLQDILGNQRDSEPDAGAYEHTGGPENAYYASPAGSGSTCSEAAPCDLDYVKENAQPGWTVYLMDGDYGSVLFDANDAAGDADEWITYRSLNQQMARFSYIRFDGTIRDYYIKFDGIYVDPGYMTEPSSYNNVVSLSGANHITFENSHFEGEKIAGAEMNQGDFAPYSFTSGIIIRSGESPGLSSYVTINNCTFRYGYRQLYVVQHPRFPERKVENWTITNNDFSECGEDCIVTSVSGGHYIADNSFHDPNQYRIYFCWSGFHKGDWSGRRGETMTQEGTGASAFFYEISNDMSCSGFTGDIMILYADDVDNRPRRSVPGDWVLDSDTGVFFIIPQRYRYFNGTMSGDWTGRRGENITQDSTGATGVFEMNTSSGYFYITPNSEIFPGQGFAAPSVDDHVWRLDSDPSGIYFTPNPGHEVAIIDTTGDNSHNDFIALQSTTHDTLVENNVFNNTVFGAQTIKIEPGTRNVTFQKNLIFSEYTSAYQILLAGNVTRILHNTVDIADGTHPASALRAITSTAPGYLFSDTYLENNIISGAVYSSGTVSSDDNIWGSSPPAEFNEPGAVIADFNSLFAGRGTDYTPVVGSPACSGGIITHGHLAGQACAQP